MSSLITPPHPQFINPLFGCPVGNGFIYIGYKDTDAMVPNNQQPVYLLGEDNSKTPIPQPLRTNGVGVLIYQGLPATVWVDDAYSIAILNENGVLMYQSLYVDDPTYWLRQDLATLPTPEDPDTVSLTAQTDLIGPFEPVLAKEGDTDPISLDLTTPATCRFGPYRIRTLQFTPAGTSGKYTIILSQWEE